MNGRGATILALVTVLVTAGPACAGALSLEIGPLAGTTVLDPGLADYRWDTAPRFESGLETTVGRERWGLGLRLRNSRTTQGTGLATGPADPVVRLTSAEFLGRYRVARPLGIGIWTSVHAGWMHLGYTPDELTIAPDGGLDPVTVQLDPVNELAAGCGLLLRRTLGRTWALALAGEASTFALDTAHRRGENIVLQRDRFWNWSARLVVTWRLELGS